ncbi:MAG: hypothetical protein KDA59_26725, partial [Planctomycetales bacterium]|nr:hypothetical protein [Planctomycetales bacterium]
MVAKPRFIASQRLLRLSCPPGEELEYFEPGRFRLRRMKERGQQIDAAAEAELTHWSGAWEQVDDRMGFLIDPGTPHLCITIGAGIGKTTATRQLRYLRQQHNPREMVLWLDVSELPHAMDEKSSGRARKLECEYLDEADAAESALVAVLRRGEVMKDCPTDTALRLLHHKIRQRQLTLIVDGLDQIDMENDRAARDVIAG